MAVVLGVARLGLHFAAQTWPRLTGESQFANGLETSITNTAPLQGRQERIDLGVYRTSLLYR